MLKGLRTFLFTVFISLGGLSSAEAQTRRCETVFNPSVKDVLESLDHNHSHFLFQGKTFEEFSQTLSWYKKRKLRRLTQNLEIRSLPSEKALERYSIEVAAILFGSKEIVDRWVFKSKDQRLEESTLLLIKEKLLTEGLLKTWSDTHNPAQIGVLRKSLDRIWSLQNSPLGQVARLPFILPTIKNSEISKPLMYKVIRDGFNAHAEEVQMALGKQNKIEAYNTFRKLYSPVFFGLTLIINIQHAYAEMDRMMDQQIQQTIQDLREQRESLEKNVPIIKDEIFQQAYAQALAEFNEKWGESPTLEEQTLLKAKIEKALNMN